MSRKLWIRLLLISSFFISFLLSIPLWFSERSFPTVPLFFNSLKLNYSLDILLLILFALSAVWFLVKDKSKGGLIFFLFYLFFSILDQTRIQPFFFEIAIIILLYYIFRNNFQQFKIAFLILMAGTYIWSGLHKANPVFYELWLGGVNKRIPFVPPFLRQLFTWVVPFLEMSFGVALLFNKTRKSGIILLTIMHSMVLITLTLSGGGFTVFPLNILNPLFLFMICYRLDWSLFKSIKKANFKLKIVAVYAIMLPALNLFGMYDHLLSFSYFSGKPNYINIILLNKEDINKLPKVIADIAWVYEGNHYINVNEWSLKYVNVLCYPEERVYEFLQDYIETFTGGDSTYLQYYKK